MKIQFDEKRLINDVIKQLNVEMDLVAKVLVEFMIGEISQSSSSNPSFEQWKLDVIDALRWRAVAVSGQLMREIGVLDQSDPSLYKAMAVEFGTGSKADTTDNPWIQEYLSSEWYHSSRNGMSIYSLPGEEIYDPDSNSWKQSNAENREPLPFLEERGSLYWTNIFGNSAIMAQTYFDKGIERAIARIDFSNYLIVS
ncbi:hypothetical protein G9F71_008280 [Clostridium sp. FP2]|uniref:hypothetical protein n=1 Tax=Clostridium sp. FP2 TaxID=2724481 RepID=UPI0013E924F2|nr:hypothetical protein [Clostridium sp. FP2]MBZ9622848.1 hypothetical protein [Clostridium sp. FP2]